MSLRALPLIAFAYIIYAAIVAVAGGAGDATVLLSKPVLPLPVATRWVTLTWGDIIILLALVLLAVEIFKSTYTATAALVDHALSMFVFIAALVAFLLVPLAGTGVFFNLLLITLIDVIAGYTIAIRVAKRDIGFGGAEG